MDLKNKREITIEHNGKKYRAWYMVQKGVIAVFTGEKTKYGQIESLPPDAFARMILSEMIQDGEV